MVIVALILLHTLSTSQVDNANLPLTYPARVINTNEQVCPPNEVQVSEQNEVAQDIQGLLRTVAAPSCHVFQTSSSPAASCSALPISCPSGYYWVRSSNGSAVQVYCDMDRVCGCNDTGGWTRVANLNMTDPNQQCPGAWMLQNYTTEPRRLCGHRIRYGCSSAKFNTSGIRYSQVCGRIIGYQFSSPDAVYLFDTKARSIESYYVDGVSLTHGPPGARQHIWSFAAAFKESTYSCCVCPCANRNTQTAPVPSFVGNDFFCESGNKATEWSNHEVLYTSDPLWDGQGCGSPPCCELSYPPGVTAPWFCKQLPQTAMDDIEARIKLICNEPEHGQGDDTQVQLVELYIR